MKIAKTRKELELLLNDKAGRPYGFVPTMGALHKGHLALLSKSKEHNKCSVVSIFINPTQFNDHNDFDKYPRHFQRDTKMLEEHGCDILFLPDEKEIYPGGEVDWVDINLGSLEQIMEGEYRPGHFRGVKTVVYRLFKLINPDKAYFGEKDYQQLRVIQEMVKFIKMPVEIIACPTIREPDGLAMSSRNKNLNKEEREAAYHIPHILINALEKLNDIPAEEVKAFVKLNINKVPGLRLQYFTVADSTTLEPIKGRAIPGKTRIFIAVFAGNTRLIDNMAFD